jgi:hypothetical protein
LSARRSRATRREVGTERFYSGPSLLKKKNSENWKITRYSDKEFLSLSRPKFYAVKLIQQVKFSPRAVSTTYRACERDIHFRSSFGRETHRGEIFIRRSRRFSRDTSLSYGKFTSHRSNEV